MRRKGILPWCQNGNGGFFIGQFAWRKGGAVQKSKVVPSTRIDNYWQGAFFGGRKTFALHFAVQMGGRGLRKQRFQRNCLFRPPPTRCRGRRDIISWLRTRTSRRNKGGGKEINVSGEGEAEGNGLFSLREKVFPSQRLNLLLSVYYCFVLMLLVFVKKKNIEH